MKKFILTLILVPALVFSQNTKTEKVMNDVGTAVGVAAGVIGLFKKDKSKTDNKANNKTDNKAQNKTTAITNSDGTFPVNAKPEDIVANLYKCTYKKVAYPEGESQTLCIWKPTPADFTKLKQNSDAGAWTDYEKDPNLALAVEVDTVMAFQKNGINNIVIAASSHELNDYGQIADYHVSGAFTGFIRMQTTDGKTMKLISNDKLMLYSGSFGSSGQVSLLKLDDENIFYGITDSQMHQGFEDIFVTYYDMNGKVVIEYDDHNSGGHNPDDYEESETKMDIDKTNKIIKLVSTNQRYKKEKLIKTTKQIVATYQYGNGTITEIKKPAVKKTTTTKKKK